MHRRLKRFSRLCARRFRRFCALKPGSVKNDTALAGLGMDSLRLVSLLLVIEQKFGVSLMKVGLKPGDMQSVNSLAAAVVAGRSA